MIRIDAISDHKRHEQTLDSCTLCIDSTKLRKHLIVAVGLKVAFRRLVSYIGFTVEFVQTYLAVPSVQSLVEGHCFIVPMMHVPSSLQLDEDVFDEMKVCGMTCSRLACYAMHNVDLAQGFGGDAG